MLPREKEEERQAVKNLPLNKKIQHFFNYYLIQTLAIIGAIIIAIFLIYTFFIKKPDRVIFGAVLYDELLEDSKKEPFISELRELFGITDKHEVIRLDDAYFSSSYTDEMRFTVLMAANEYDVVIAGREQFTKLAASGYFQELGEALGSTDAEALADSAVAVPGRRREEAGLGDDGIGEGEVKDYGLSLLDSKRWMGLSGLNPDPVVGILTGSSNVDNARAFVRYLFDLQ